MVHSGDFLFIIYSCPNQVDAGFKYKKKKFN